MYLCAHLPHGVHFSFLCDGPSEIHSITHSLTAAMNRATGLKCTKLSLGHSTTCSMSVENRLYRSGRHLAFSTMCGPKMTSCSPCHDRRQTCSLQVAQIPFLGVQGYLKSTMASCQCYGHQSCPQNSKACKAVFCNCSALARLKCLGNTLPISL